MEMIPWWNLLPRPVDPQQQQYNALRALALRSQIQQQQQQTQARNALAQAIGGGATGNALLGPLAQVDPSAAIRLSMDERQRNAMLSGMGMGGGAAGDVTDGLPAGGAAPVSPGAVTQFNPQAYLQSGGDPSKVPTMMSADARAAKERADASLANQKLIDEQLHKATLHLYDELKPEYDQNVEKFGQKRAEEIYLEHRAKLIPEMKASADYAAIADKLKQSAPFSVLERNALGVKELREQQKEKREEQKQAATIFKPDFKGTVVNPDGTKIENVPLAYGGPNGYIDTTTNKPVQVDPSSIVHMPRTGATAQKPMPAPLDAEVIGANGKPETRPVYRQPNGQVIDAITNEPIPSDQIKMIRPASAGRPRSAATAFITKYMEEHPDATAEDVAGAAAGFAAQQGGTRAFLGGGRQGDAVRFIGNVVGDHLPTLDKLGDALGNNDVKALNTLKNTLKAQFGYAGPVNFDAAKSIVSGEITKAVVGGVASMQDRQVLMDDLNRSNSPEQLKGVISTFRMLLAGQLRGLYRQSQVAKVPDDKFRAMLPKSAQEMLDEQGPSGGTSTPAAPSAPAATPAAPNAPAAQPQGAVPANPATGKPLTPQDFAAAGKNRYQDPATGQIWVVRDGKVVPEGQ